MTCRCHNYSCGRCLPTDIKQALVDFEEAEESSLPNARRDNKEWNERVRRAAETK